MRSNFVSTLGVAEVHQFCNRARSSNVRIVHCCLTVIVETEFLSLQIYLQRLVSWSLARRRRGERPFRSSYRATACLTALRHLFPVTVNVGRYSFSRSRKFARICNRTLHLYCVVPTDCYYCV